MSEPMQPYREPGTDTSFVMCPTCHRTVTVEGEWVACAHCQTRFASRDATTLLEYRATQHLAQTLEVSAPDRGLSARARWTLTGGVLAIIVACSLVFGYLGFLWSFAAAFALAGVAKLHTRAPRY